MTSHSFDPKLDPSPLCHAKMGALPTPSYRMSQKYIPTSYTSVKITPILQR